jgi:nucleotide-binding universal stress UspA family protein
MRPWRRILCGVDFCEPSRGALETAADLARLHESELTLVYVHPDIPASLASALRPPAAFEHEAHEAEKRLAAWRAEAQQRAGRDVNAVFAHGDPAQELLRLAAAGRYDLVVTGTHGRGGLRRVAMGSVAETVVRRGPCPVLVARAPHAEG